MVSSSSWYIYTYESFAIKGLSSDLSISVSIYINIHISILRDTILSFLFPNRESTPDSLRSGPSEARLSELPKDSLGLTPNQFSLLPNKLPQILAA